ncbi:hypothetical protein GUJ93_ZPchr0012g20639 [Zizania palustris]|uniref:Uncharacterized protein n=1 Tax=Zizania palustris TaxID=103762 RepID=A0A8J5WQY9_ZIZPA|nr:hypothetical protein GUJ93_ZPchr0012g20639 [Zizania palustris]
MLSTSICWASKLTLAYQHSDFATWNMSISSSHEILLLAKESTSLGHRTSSDDIGGLEHEDDDQRADENEATGRNEACAAAVTKHNSKRVAMARRGGGSA